MKPHDLPGELVAAYSAPGRYYHGLEHILDCLDKLYAIDSISRADKFILSQAIWWHDVVYDPTRSDNEEQSALLAEKSVSPSAAEEIGRLIRLTKAHDVAAEDYLGAIMISIDLSILGADGHAYDAYRDAIRREYAHVPEQDYRAGRAQVLRRFLGRAVIYPYAPFAKKYDRRARENLIREIAFLS